MVKKEGSFETKIGMIGAFVNIIWLGVVFLVIFIRTVLITDEWVLPLIATIIYSFAAALVLNSSAKYDINKNSYRRTIFGTVILLLNSLILGYLINPQSFLLNFLVLLGPGYILIVLACYLQIKNAKVTL
jgi:uncharacterized membrane protein YjjP (DUF1212 family)